MKILIDSVTVGSPGGIQLQRELAWAAARTAPTGGQVTLLISKQSPDVEKRVGLDVLKVEVPSGNFKGRWTWYNRVIPRMLKEGGFNVLYAQSGLFSRRSTEVAGVMTTVNNMLPFTPLLMAEYPIWSKERLKFRVLRHLYTKNIRLADSVLLHSKHALNQMEPFVGSFGEKTRIALTGVPSNLDFNPSKPPTHPRGEKPFFFYLSSMQKYKNHLNLIAGYERAIQKLGSNGPDLVLAGIGFDRDYTRKVFDAIARSPVKEKISYLENPPRDLLPGLIHHATANYFPSLCETNSVIQAEIVGMHGVMACSDIPPMPEVAGKAALLFDPYSAESIAQSMVRISSDPALGRSLREKSSERARELSWDDCGRAIWDCASLASRKFKERIVK